MKHKLIFLIILLVFKTIAFSQSKINNKNQHPIPVLNMGTFHMGYTSDAHSTEFDEHNVENIKLVHQVAKALAEFKPTVIVIEYPPSYNNKLMEEYQEYLANPSMTFENPSEVELLAFELGRLSGVKKLYGIDYREGYNYMIGSDLDTIVDKATVTEYRNSVYKQLDDAEEQAAGVIEQLYLTNTKEYLDEMINVNADILTHISSPGKWEGAEEASKYYHRNLVMYSNLNQIPLTKDDRVFILMGASHTAFFNMWLSRSPKYQLVDIFDYLKLSK